MLNLQETFRELGGFGTYQALVCFTGCITCCFAGLIISGGAFHNLLTCSNIGNSNQTLVEAAENSSSSSSNSSSSSSKHGFTTSVSAEYGLCDRQAALGELSSVFLLAGCIPGSLLAGPAADTLGRIPGTLIGLLGSVTMNLLALLAPYFWLHLASRLVCGFFVSWTLGSIYVYGNEVLMTEHRSRFVKLYNLGPAIGSILLAYLAYVVRDYKRLMIANNFVAIPSALVAAILPESPSWLLSQRSRPAAQVKRALQRIARINRLPVPDSVLGLDSGHVMQLTEADSGPREVEQTSGSARIRPLTGGSLCTAIKRLLSDRLAVFYLLSTCLYSFSSGFAYYGFTFVITHAVPNIYVTFALMGAVEPPSLLLLNVFSRSRTLFFSALATVLCCLAIGATFAAVPPADLTLGVSILMVSLAVGGKFSSNIAFCAIMAFGAEIYPTAVRNTGLGLLMATLRTGCMLSPLVNFIPYMPARFAVLGLACLLSAFPTRSLPDTRIRDLTETRATGRDGQEVVE